MAWRIDFSLIRAAGWGFGVRGAAGLAAPPGTGVFGGRSWTSAHWLVCRGGGGYVGG
jgi:hypothetical protein